MTVLSAKPAPTTESTAGVRRPTAVVCAIAAAAITVRFATLSRQSYWSDEAATVALVKPSLGGMLGAIPTKERTPPVY